MSKASLTVKQREAHVLMACAHSIQAANATLPESSRVAPRLAMLAADLTERGRALGGAHLAVVGKGA